MKTAKINRDEVCESSLTVPMKKGEKKAVQEAADDIGVSMSAFARMALKDFMKKANE